MFSSLPCESLLCETFPELPRAGSYCNSLPKTELIGASKYTASVLAAAVDATIWQGSGQAAVVCHSPLGFSQGPGTHTFAL